MAIERIEQTALFDYAALDTETRDFVQESAQSIRTQLKRTVEGVIVIGQNLIAVKDRLPHGMFLPWLRAEFDLSERTAQNFMHAAKLDLKSAESADLAVSLFHEPHSVIEMVATGQIPATLPAIREANQQIESTPERIAFFEQWQQDNLALGLDAFGDVIPTENLDVQEDKERRDAHVLRVMGSSDSDEWYTPQEIINRVLACFGQIDLDPCSNSHESPAVPSRKHYTREENGLAQSWFGKVYMNPPYGSEIPEWVQSLVTFYEQGDIEEAIALLPGRIDTQWFQPLYAYPMCHVRGRIQYANSPYHAPFPCVVVYLGRTPGKFIAAFKELGPIMGRIG